LSCRNLVLRENGRHQYSGVISQAVNYQGHGKVNMVEVHKKLLCPMPPQ